MHQLSLRIKQHLKVTVPGQLSHLQQQQTKLNMSLKTVAPFTTHSMVSTVTFVTS